MTYTNTNCDIVLIEHTWSGPDYVCVIYDKTKTTLEAELRKSGFLFSKYRVLHSAEGIKDYVVNGQRTKVKLL